MQQQKSHGFFQINDLKGYPLRNHYNGICYLAQNPL